ARWQGGAEEVCHQGLRPDRPRALAGGAQGQGHRSGLGGHGRAHRAGPAKRVDKDVIAKKPSIVVIQIGCNDARRIPKDTFQTGLGELIDKLQKANIQVIQCSLTSVGEKHDGTNKDDAKLEEFAAVARQVAKEKKVPRNDLRKAFVEHWKKNNPENK